MRFSIAFREACAEGEQAYWVCPVIEESKDGDLQTAIDTHATLTRELRGLRVGLLHGRLPTAEKAAVMEAFAKGGRRCWSARRSSRSAWTWPMPR